MIQYQCQVSEEKKTNDRNFVIEKINGQKIIKRKPIAFLHMIIKDYLDLQIFNWKHLKENQELYETDKKKLDQFMDNETLETAMK